MFLFDFALPDAFGDLTATVAAMPGTGAPAWKVDAGPDGGRLVFRGAPGSVGGPRWSDDRLLIVPVRQDTEHVLWLGLLFWETPQSGAPSDSLPHADISMGIFPGFEVPVVFPLKNLDLSTLFLPRTPGRMKNVSVGSPVDPGLVTCMALNIPRSAGRQIVWIGQPYLSDSEPAYAIPAEPVVDPIGQWNRKAWKGKTSGGDEMIANLKQWAGEPSEPLDRDVDEYGGWLGQRKAATGYFRKERDSRRWWLIDPAGRPFFSVGPDCVEPASAGPVQGIEALFAWLPPHDGEYADAWRARYGGSEHVSFPVANMIRAFGGDWRERWEKMTERRLRRWGFNTIANWSDHGLGPRLGMPYVTQMHSFPTTTTRIFRDLPDVFSAEYARSAATCAESLRPLREDPLLIGYFLSNEPTWAFGDYNLGELVLACPDALETRDALIRFLAERYGTDPSRLASAWNHPIESFDDLARPIRHAASLSPAAQEDLRAFNAVLIDEYVRVAAEAARRVMPNHLSLGLRWAWIASDAFYAGSAYCDVFSINCYQMNPDPEAIRVASQKTGLPVMIGEFHAGALDVGLPANALRGVKDQAGRGQFYRWYIEHAAAIPELVGAHYFQWNDQPALGRFDGECLNIGLVDVCQKPYFEMVTEIAETHRRLYGICAGNIEPASVKPVEMPREGF